MSPGYPLLVAAERAGYSGGPGEPALWAARPAAVGDVGGGGQGERAGGGMGAAPGTGKGGNSVRGKPR